MGGKMTLGTLIPEKECPRCGKTFSPTPMWAVNFKGKPCCSISCMWALEREAERKKKRKLKPAEEQYAPEKAFRKPKIRPEVRNQIYAMVLEGAVYREIAERFGCAHSVVSQIARDNGIVRRRGPRERNEG